MINIVKTSKGKFLIGEGGKVKSGFRIKTPFEMIKSEAGISITPYDVKILDTFIPFIDFTEKDYEYIVTAEDGLSDFYNAKSRAFIEEVKNRNSSPETPETPETPEE